MNTVHSKDLLNVRFNKLWTPAYLIHYFIEKADTIQQILSTTDSLLKQMYNMNPIKG